MTFPPTPLPNLHRFMLHHQSNRKRRLENISHTFQHRLYSVYMTNVVCTCKTIVWYTIEQYTFTLQFQLLYIHLSVTFNQIRN